MDKRLKRFKSKLNKCECLRDLRPMMDKFTDLRGVNFMAGMIDTVGQYDNVDFFKGVKLQLLDYCDNPSQMSEGV